MATHACLRPRRGSKENWFKSDPVLKDGEFAIEREKDEDGSAKGAGKIKIGDGIHKYSELPYFLSYDPEDYDKYNKSEEKTVINNTYNISGDFNVFATDKGSENSIIRIKSKEEMMDLYNKKQPNITSGDYSRKVKTEQGGYFGYPDIKDNLTTIFNFVDSKESCKIPGNLYLDPESKQLFIYKGDNEFDELTAEENMTEKVTIDPSYGVVNTSAGIDLPNYAIATTTIGTDYSISIPNYVSQDEFNELKEKNKELEEEINKLKQANSKETLTNENGEVVW